MRDMPTETRLRSARLSRAAAWATAAPVQATYGGRSQRTTPTDGETPRGQRAPWTSTEPATHQLLNLACRLGRAVGRRHPSGPVSVSVDTDKALSAAGRSAV